MSYELRISDWSSDVCSADLVDAYSTESANRAKQAIADGSFRDEIVPVTIKTRKGDVVVDTDEQPGRIDTAKIPTLRPAFGKDGVLTAASSSSISDGAAATVLMSADEAGKRRSEEHTSELQSLMRISYAVYCLKKK